MTIQEQIKELIKSQEIERIISVITPDIINDFEYSGIEEHIEILHSIAQSYLLNFQYTEAFQISVKVLALTENTKNRKLKAECLLQHATLLMNGGLNDEAMAVVREAFLISDILNDKLLEADAANCIAQLFYKTGLIERALEMAQRSLTLVREYGSEDIVAKVLQTNAVFLQGLNRFDETFMYLEEALEISKKRNDTVGIINCLSSLAYSYGHKKEYVKGLDYFLECIKLEKSSTVPNAIREAGILKGIAISYSALKDFEKAKQYASELLSLSEKSTDEIVKQYAYIANSSVLNDVGMYNEAFEFYRLFHKSIMEERTEKAQKQLQLLHVIYETEKKEKEAELIKVKAQQLENEVKLKKNEVRLKQNQIRTKQNELTATALHLAQKNTMLMKLESIANADFSSVDEANILIQKIREEIRSGIVNDQAWKAFEEQFKKTHGGLQDRLVKKFPVLSPMEVKICSMIALDLSSKDIAAILCVEVNSVEVYRYRIRKKLDVKGKESLKKIILSV